MKQEDALPSTAIDSVTPAMRRLLWVSVSGVFLDGYDISIIGLGLLQVKGQFHALPWQLGLVGSAILIGNFLGALIFGRLSDRLGRRTVFIADVIFFLVFALLSGLAQNIWQLILWRFLLGVGIGGDYALASPIIAEAVPARRRGRLLVINWGLAWLSGEIVSFAVGLLLLSVAGATAWRWMLASGALPALIVLLVRRSMPESARWLLTQGRDQEAQHAVEALTGSSDVERLIPGATAYRAAETAVARASAWSELWGRFRRNTWYGLLNYVFEGAPFYALSVFLPTILTEAGYAKSLTGVAEGNLILQITGLLGILLIYLWVDTRGRRFVNYWGYGGVLGALLIYQLVFPPSPALLMALFIVIEVAVWLGPASTDNLLLGELWPTRIRGTGAGVGAAAGRLSAIAGTLGLPVLISAFGLRVALLLPALFCALGILNTALLGVETKGKTLEELWGL